MTSLLTMCKHLSTASALPPSALHLAGRTVSLSPLQPEHSRDLKDLLVGPEHDVLWRFMSNGPFHSPETFAAHIVAASKSTDPLFYALTSVESGKVIGYASLMRMDTRNRVIEVGNIMYSPALRQSTAATEAMYLLAKYVFENLGYRRYEWKCNNLNEASKKAAKRLGFIFEGIFRQHMIVKGQNRDTAWYSMLDCEWPAVKQALELWLDPNNFDDSGKQVQRLQDFQHFSGAAHILKP